MKRFRSVCAALAVLIAVLGLSVGIAQAQQKVTITYWVDPRFSYVEGYPGTQFPGDFEMIQAKKFMEMHPNVEIKVEVIPWADLSVRIPAAIAAGSPPDILRDYLGRTSVYAKEGLLEPVNEVLPQAFIDRIDPSFRELYTIDGELHAIPLYAWAATAVANRALWAAIGQEELIDRAVERGSWTFEEFEEAMRAVAKRGLWPLGMEIPPDGQADYYYLAFFWGYGARVFEEGDYSRVALNTPAGVQALTKLVEWAKEGLIQPGAPTATRDQLDGMMWRGQVAVRFSDPGIWTRFNAAKAEGRVTTEVDLVPVPYPTEEGVQAGMAVGPTGLAIFKQQDPVKRQLVLEFAQFLAQEEYIYTYSRNAGQFPAFTGIDDPFFDQPHMSQISAWLAEKGTEDTGTTLPIYTEIRARLAPEIQAAIMGVKTPAKALADFEAAANRILNR